MSDAGGLKCQGGCCFILLLVDQSIMPFTNVQSTPFPGVANKSTPVLRPWKPHGSRLSLRTEHFPGAHQGEYPRKRPGVTNDRPLPEAQVPCGSMWYGPKASNVSSLRCISSNSEWFRAESARDKNGVSSYLLPPPCVAVKETRRAAPLRCYPKALSQECTLKFGRFSLEAVKIRLCGEEAKEIDAFLL